MIGRAALTVCVLLWAVQAKADSRTNCRTSLMGHVTCDTIDSPDDRAFQDGVSSLAAAIASRRNNSRKRQPEPDVADLTTGNGFLASCAPQPNSLLNAGLCYGYVRGFLNREWMNGDEAAVCLPTTVPMSQFNAIIADFIEKHPQERHYPLGYLAYASLTDAFPCPQPQGTNQPPEE